MLLVYLAAAAAAGILAAQAARFPWPLWAWWFVLPAGLLLLWRRDAALRRLHWCLLFFLLAGLRYTAALPSFDEHSLARLNDAGPVTLVGDVVDPPVVHDRLADVRLAVARARVGREWRDVTGLALVQVPRETGVRYGDRLEVYGEPATPFESPDFSYKDYLARQGIFSVVRVYGGVTVLARDQGHPFFAALYAFRDRAAATVRALFPEPSASLLVGILLGDDAGIPRDLEEAFRATNTAHIIAISGFNISVIAGLLTALLARLFRRRGLVTLFVAAGLIVYTLLVGASPSVVRATIMAGVALLARYCGRQNDGLNALAFAALVMLALDPTVLLDLGFQLSFGATLGLIFYVQPLTAWFQGLFVRWMPAERAQQVVGALSDSFIVTLAAQVTTLPLLVFAFHKVSPIALVTNLLVLPAQPAVMVLGGLATLVGMALPPLGQVLAWVAWPFLEWTIRVVAATASLPFASVDIGRSDLLLVLLYYALLFGWTLYGGALRAWLLAPFRQHAAPQAPASPPAAAPVPAAPNTSFAPVSSTAPISPTFALGVVLILGLWLWNATITLPDGKTHVEFLDVGGAATLVRTPSGARVLIDGGANPSALLAALGSRMPFWDRSLDLVVLADPDDSHLAGLVAALEQYDVRQIVQANAPAKPNAAYVKWTDLIAQKRIASAAAEPGLSIAIDRGVTLDLLPPAGTLRLTAGHLTVLFADNLDEAMQASLMKAEMDPSSTVLVTPRKLTPAFLDAVNPQIVVFFAGSGVRDQPSADLLAALSGVTLLRTDERGTVELVVEAEGVRMRTGK
jgi:competence protein ComEC